MVLGRVAAVSVGKIRPLEVRGRASRSGIFKTPVSGPVRVADHHLEGDEQAEPKIHGGASKAVYAFPTEHYEGWRKAFPNIAFDWGVFGENLSLEGVLEADVVVGDRFRCGSAELIVTEPRFPCSKFVAKLGDSKVSKYMLSQRQTGFYLSIAQEGFVEAGDTFERIYRPEGGLSIPDMVQMQIEGPK
ncbi:MAG: MOSC domain-containing protein [Myxococcota bacterium]